MKLHLDGRLYAASIALAAAIAIKLIPLILLLFLILRKRFWEATLAAVGAAVLCLLPAIFLGQDIINVYEGYAQTFLLGSLTGNGAAATDQIYFTVSGFVSWLIPSAASWPALKMASAGLVIVLIVSIDCTMSKKSSEKIQLWAFNLYLMAILLISPLSEIHHLAYLIPSVLILMLGLCKQQFSPKLVPAATLGLFFTLHFLASGLRYGPFYFFSILLLLFFVIIQNRLTQS